MPAHTHKPRSARFLDAMAIGLSGLCVVHCLALPFLIVALPMLGSLSDNEWVHKILIGLALPISLWAIGRSGRWRRPDVFLPLVIGLGLLTAAAFVVEFRAYETELSVVGATFLAFAHIRNAWSAHRHKRPVATS